MMQIEKPVKCSEKVAQAAEAIVALAQGKHLLLASDRDGTLVAYADRPEDALLDPRVYDLMNELAVLKNVTAAVVSARSTAQLRAEFDERKLILAGNYGLEIRYPNRTLQTNKEAQASFPQLKEARDELAVLVRGDVNAILEDHGYSLCLHWHTVEADARPQMHATVKRIASYFPQLTFRDQPTSYEVLPKLEWSKADALAAIAETLPKSTAFVFFGDSEADEAAFAWVNERGGISIKVGSAGSGTASQFQLADTKETEALLEQLAQCL